MRLGHSPVGLPRVFGWHVPEPQAMGVGDIPVRLRLDAPIPSPRSGRHVVATVRQPVDRKPHPPAKPAQRGDTNLLMSVGGSFPALQRPPATPSAINSACRRTNFVAAS
jgi:hypothetical protein